MRCSQEEKEIVEGQRRIEKRFEVQEQKEERGAEVRLGEKGGKGSKRRRSKGRLEEERREEKRNRRG